MKSASPSTYEVFSHRGLKHGNFEIRYGLHQSPFGWCLIGVTQRGISYLSFLDNNNSQKARDFIKEKWPKALLIHDQKATEKYMKIFERKNKKQPVHLVLKGTNFQIKVWDALLKIPKGKVSSYLEIARKAGHPQAVRAVGTACGKNSIAFLIPCHRVLTSSGKIGGYRWGVERKEAMLAWESANKS